METKEFFKEFSKGFILVALSFFIGVLFFKACNAEAAEVSIKPDAAISVAFDLGENTRIMLQQLAKTAGVTVEELFPSYVGYVKAKALYGILSSLVVMLILVFLLFIVAVIGTRDEDRWPYRNLDRSGIEFVQIFLGVTAICAGILLFAWAVGIGLSLSDTFTSYQNPVPEAIRMMAKALGEARK